MDSETLRAWLIQEVAQRLKIKAADLDPRRPLSELGLSSEQTIEIAAALENRLGQRVGPEILYDHPTLDALLTALEAGSRASPAGAAPVAAAEAIAIVGIGCRFPGAGVGPQALWRFLNAAGDAVSVVPANRWRVAGAGDSGPSGETASAAQWGAFLPEVDRFDAGAFVISPQEAAQMDPQQRLLLEAAWHAIEDTGRAPASLAGSRTGVFVGISQSEYLRDRFLRSEELTPNTPSGNALSIAANRISYTFDLRGPSLAVDTACSSSLMAVHLACQSLRRGETDFALAGGVNVLMRPDVSVAFAQAGLMAADGRCKAFDDSADGYVRGEGVGLIALKRLADALADGDEIYAQILGIATIQDGHSNGLMAPRGSAQEAAIEAACADAGVSPADIGYFEAHGTGTALGDVIEATALGRVLARADGPAAAHWLGSIKTNIGHLESAAGIAGLIKAALCLHNRALVPSLHFNTPNRAIDFPALGLSVSVDQRPWAPPSGARLAGVSSFGFGGTNVHAVLAEPPKASAGPRDDNGIDPVVMLSAHDTASIAELANACADQLEGSSDADGRRLAAALGRRAILSTRLAVSAPTSAELAAELRRAAEALPFRGTPSAGTTGRTAFIFTGQGALAPGAGADLFKRNRVFRQSMLQTDAVLRDHLGASVLPALFSPESAQLLQRTAWAQPALFALQMALVDMLADWGVVPAAVVGHSVGEIAAACAAGQLRLEEAARLVALRGRAMDGRFGQGRMAVLAASAQRVAELLAMGEGGLEIAATNAPEATVVAGPPDRVEWLLGICQARQIGVHMLPVEYAFHTADMADAAARLAGSLGTLAAGSPGPHFYSSVTGALMADGTLDAAYWARNVRDAVRFDRSVAQILADGYDNFVEIGPHPALSNDVLAIAAEQDRVVRTMATLRRRELEAAAMGRAAAALFEAGAIRSPEAILGGTQGQLALPPLPWAGRTRHWIEPSAPREAERRHAFLDPAVELAFEPGRQLARGALNAADSTLLTDHRVLGETVVPGAAYIDMMLHMARQVLGDGPLALEDIMFPHLLILQPGEATEVQIAAAPPHDGRIALEIFARRAGQSWKKVAAASACLAPPEEGAPPVVAPDAISARCFDRYPGQLFYSLLAQKGLEYGPSLVLLDDVQGRKGESLGRFAPKGRRPLHTKRHAVDPALLDGAFHAMAAAFGAKQLSAAEGALFLPQSIERMIVHRGAGTCLWAHCRLLGQGEKDARADLVIADEAGRPLVNLRGFTVRGARTDVLRERSLGAAREGWLYDIGWQEALLPPAAPSAPSLGAVLLLRSAGCVGDALGSACRGAASHLFEVVHGGDLQRCGIDPGSVDELRDIVRKAPDGGWTEIIHALNCSDAPMGPPEDLQALGGLPASLAWLVQAIETSGVPGRPRLTLLTRGAVATRPGEPLDPVQATAWGLARAIVLEHPTLEVRRIDIDADDDRLDADWQARVAHELARPDIEDQVALRQDSRWVARLRTQRSGLARPIAVDADGTYLITGGGGALGSHVARALAERGARTLVLTSRRVQPEDAANDARTLPGVNVVRIACDVADPAAVDALFTRMAELPALRGVVHAAGVISDSALLRIDRSSMTAVLAPKILGIENIARATAGLPLDFFVTYSSAASVLGSPGQANYCAANAYMDAFAQRETANGRRTLSISWGAWAGDGMADLGGDRRHSMTKSGLINMVPPVVGTDLLFHLLASDVSHVAVLPFSVRALVQFYPSNSGLNFFADVMTDVAAIRSDGGREETKQRPNLGNPHVAARNDIETAIVGMWERALGMVGVGVQDELFALGGDSVFASRILSQVSQTFAIRIDPQNAFDSFTVERLAELVDLELTRLVDSLDDASIEEALAEAERARDTEPTI